MQRGPPARPTSQRKPSTGAGAASGAAAAANKGYTHSHLYPVPPRNNDDDHGANFKDDKSDGKCETFDAAMPDRSDETERRLSEALINTAALHPDAAFSVPMAALSEDVATVSSTESTIEWSSRSKKDVKKWIKWRLDRNDESRETPEFCVRDSNVIVLIGQCGCGKRTLVKSAIQEINTELALAKDGDVVRELQLIDSHAVDSVQGLLRLTEDAVCLNRLQDSD